MQLLDELELLDELISKTLDPKKILHADITPDLFNRLHEIAVNEHERIRKRFKQIHYSRDKERLKEQYVQQHQRDIIELMDKVIDYLLPQTYKDLTENDVDTGLAKLYKRLFALLQSLLSFIEKHLSKYFNLDANVPVSYLLLTQAEIRDRVKAIKQKLLQDESAHEIASFVLAPINQLCGTHEPVSYKRFLYVKELMEELEGLPSVQGDTHHPRKGMVNSSIERDSILELLYYLNFNSGKLSQWIIERIVKVLNGIHDQRERIAWLYEYLKGLNQLQVKPGVKLVPEADGLKDQVITWIEEEISFLERRESLFTMTPVSTDIQDEEKIHFGVPASVLSLLSRSAFDAKLVLNKNKKKVYETLARISTTPGSQSPSAGSLIKKGYDPERAQKDKAIGLLHEMIRCVMKY